MVSFRASRKLRSSGAKDVGPPAIGALLHRFFLGEGSPTEIDYRKKGTLILASLLEDLGYLNDSGVSFSAMRLPKLLV